ncbi:hypothetical protein BB559_007277 [Furculomyces boomerangus]|uniref:Peptidase S1 domain-containing protein n=1 Tax=Furculomyces boomerangus TaxID=61424 RepID=A0A2T9XY04_9FUNG|nr:hypothetical protein BB559_007277 [Furculomyces boomerangus]
MKITFTLVLAQLLSLLSTVVSAGSQEHYILPKLKRETNPSQRISNGVPAFFKNFSSTVIVYAKRDSLSGLSCGGTLLSPNVVVTAAHCIYAGTKKELPVSSLYVGAGSERFLNGESDIYAVKTVNVHPEFDKKSLDNDLAIITLHKNITNQNVTYAKIFNKEVNEDMSVEAAGWGFSSKDSKKFSETLMSVDLHISSSTNCKILNKMWNGNKRSVCTSNINGKDTCYGDSGGPLLYTGDIRRPVIGVVSFGNAPGKDARPECGLDGGVAYYTNLNYYIPWIKSISKVFSKDMLFFNEKGDFQQENDVSEESSSQNLSSSPTESSSEKSNPTNIRMSSVDNSAFILKLSSKKLFCGMMLIFSTSINNLFINY